MIATNNGSFPWRDSPAGRELQEARRGLAAGAPSTARLRELEDRVIRYLVDAQMRTGLDLIPDGLLRREDPTRHFALQLNGVEAGSQAKRFDGRELPHTVPVIEAEIAWSGPVLVEDFLFAAGGADRAIKPVITGPLTLSLMAEDRIYGDPNGTAMAFAIAINRELRALQSSGAAFVQIDEPALLDHPEMFPIYSRLWEVLGRGIGGTLCLHLAEGPLEPIYAGLMRLKRLGCLSVGGAPDTLDLLRRSPPIDGLRLSIGVVDGRGDRIATAADIIRCIDGGAGLPPPDRLLLGTAADLGGLPTDVAIAKLRSLAEAVQILGSS